MSLFSVQKILLNSYSNKRAFEVEQIINFKKEILKKTNLLEFIESDVSFDDIGGLDKLKQWLKKMAGGWTEQGINFGLQPLKGLLLVGVPGTGKSLICKSLANEYKIPLIKFDPSKLFSSRVGDSEANMHMALNLIETQAPCVLFIDEIEKAFAGIHSSTFSDAGTTARVIGVYLTWMQECKKSIFTVATSNMIQYLPPELISRFDETFFVNIPSEEERTMIFKIHLKRALSNIKDEKYYFDIDKDCTPLALAINSKDLTGREIEQVVKESMYEAFNSKSGPTKLNDIIITEVLKKKIPIIKTMDKVLEYLINWVGYDESKKDGIRARFASGGEKEWNNLKEFLNILKSNNIDLKNDNDDWNKKL
jgi:SpoVK/Ycf46/Vps4 family AAA+-type ATPase